MKDKKEEIKLEEQSAKPFRYRYFCPACTNAAFFSYDKAPFESRVCEHCGKLLTDYKEENYIKL